MENNDNQKDFYDLSRVLDGVELKPSQGGEGKIIGNDDTPFIYRRVFRLSGGMIRTQGQARIVVIIFLIVINALTFMIAFGRT